MTAHGWRPIATAPMDGTPFLMCARDDLNVFYFVAQRASENDFVLDWDGHPLTETVFGEFVGWQPLPLPPPPGSADE